MCVRVWCVCEIERRKESKRTMSFTWLLCTFLPVDFAASIASLFLQFSACYQQKKNMKQPTNAKHAPEEAKNLTAPRYEIECVDIREKRRTARTSGKNHLKKIAKLKIKNWCAVCVCVHCNVVTGVYSIIIRTESRRCCSAALSLLFECGVCVYVWMWWCSLSFNSFSPAYWLRFWFKLSWSVSHVHLHALHVHHYVCQGCMPSQWRWNQHQDLVFGFISSAKCVHFLLFIVAFLHACHRRRWEKIGSG